MKVRDPERLWCFCKNKRRVVMEKVIRKREGMHHFDYKGDELYCEGLRIAEIVEKTGTPVYIYSYSTFKGIFRSLTQHLKRYPSCLLFMQGQCKYCNLGDC
jgi:hypothetical protein